MQAGAKQFIGGFLIAVIVVVGMCGFMAVDLGTDRYMPGKIGPMLSVTALENSCVDFSFMGEPYTLDLSETAWPLSYLDEFQGLLPPAARTAAGTAQALSDWLSRQGEDAVQPAFLWEG